MTAKKTASKKAPVKKAPVKKVAAKKPTAKKAPAKSIPPHLQGHGSTSRYILQHKTSKEFVCKQEMGIGYYFHPLEELAWKMDNEQATILLAKTAQGDPPVEMLEALRYSAR